MHYSLFGEVYEEMFAREASPNPTLLKNAIAAELAKFIAASITFDCFTLIKNKGSR